MKRSRDISTPAKATSQRGKSRKITRVPRNMTLVNQGLGFPKKMVFTHRYVETGTSDTGAAGVLVQFSRSLNGMFAPGGSHQPYYFDQMAALYNHYCVTKAKITWKCLLASGNALGPQYATVGMYINDDTTMTPNLNGANENSNGTHTILSPERGMVVLKKTWDLRKWFDKYSSSDPEVIGDPASNPVEQSHVTFYFDSSLLGATQRVYSDITIDYTAEWTELKDIAAS